MIGTSVIGPMMCPYIRLITYSQRIIVQCLPCIVPGHDVNSSGVIYARSQCDPIQYLPRKRRMSCPQAISTGALDCPHLGRGDNEVNGACSAVLEVSCAMVSCNNIVICVTDEVQDYA